MYKSQLSKGIFLSALTSYKPFLACMCVPEPEPFKMKSSVMLFTLFQVLPCMLGSKKLPYLSIRDRFAQRQQTVLLFVQTGIRSQALNTQVYSASTNWFSLTIIVII